MTDREKLIELLEKAHDLAVVTCGSMNKGFGAWYADHLIANGVTFATDNNVGDKWISVKDRLPEKTGLVLGYDIGFGVLLVYYEVGVIRSGWQSITHWMPLPEPPK